jgi:hypothetical protein
MAVTASSSASSPLGPPSSPATGSSASATVVPAAEDVGIEVLREVEEQLGMTRTQFGGRRRH